MVKWKIVFTKQAQKDAKKCTSAGLKPKAQQILEIIGENPFQKPPAYEQLAGNPAGAYSRRIISSTELFMKCLSLSIS